MDDARPDPGRIQLHDAGPMRALAHPDVFLPTDIGVRNALVGLGFDPVAAIAESDRWRPWRSYALMHLWNTLMPDVETAVQKES